MYNQKQCPDTQYLQDQLDRYREEEHQRQEDWERREDEKQRERERHFSYEMRTANDWPDALRKQAILCDGEAHLDDPAGEFNDGKPDMFFTDSAAACRRALEIWREVESSKQAAIEELHRQIATIEISIRVEVASKLSAENDASGWQNVASAIEQDVNLSSWLDW